MLANALPLWKKAPHKEDSEVNQRLDFHYFFTELDTDNSKARRETGLRVYRVWLL